MMRLQTVVTLGMLGLVVGSAGADIVRFRNGQVLQGEVVESDPMWFRFRRYDTGGVVTLSWEQILEEDRDLLRRRLRLDTEADAEIPRVDGLRLFLTSGETVEGLLAGETATEIKLRTTAGVFAYRKEQVERREADKLDVLQVYTRDEAYQGEMTRRKKAGEPTSGASGHFGLAEFCMKIRHYAKAKEHYVACQAADPGFQQEPINNVLERLVALIRDADAVDLYADIERLMGNKKFEEAGVKWKALKEKFPDSPVVVENAETITQRIEEKRKAYLDGQVLRLWMTQLRGLVNKRALAKETIGENQQKTEFLLNDAKTWARKALPKEIAEAVAKVLAIPVDETKDVFARRKTYNLTRASYGGGTFIVEQANLTVPGGAGNLAGQLGKLLPPGVNPGQLGKLLPQQGQQGQPKAMQTPDDWWKKADGSERRDWMTAFYAENGGDMEVVRVESKACNTCAGKGYKTYLAPGANANAGGTRYEICARCHGVGHDRVVVFR